MKTIIYDKGNKWLTVFLIIQEKTVYHHRKCERGIDGINETFVDMPQRATCHKTNENCTAVLL